MSVRISTANGTNAYTRTSGLPSFTTFTKMAWVRFTSVGVYNDIFARGTGNDMLLQISNAAAMVVWDGVGETALGLSGWVTNRWYHVTFVKNGTTLTGFRDSVPGTTPMTFTTTPGTDKLWIGNGFSAESVVGDMFAVKIWDRALTQAEIFQEMRQVAPVNRSGLYGAYQFDGVGGHELVDTSGRGRTLTKTGTTQSTQVSPPIPFTLVARRPLGFKWSSGGTTYFQTLTAGLVSSGALARLTSTLKAGTLTSGATLVRQSGKVLSGGVTSAGAVSKRPARAVTGTVTSAASLTAVKTALLSLAASLASSGGLTKRTGKVLTGATTPTGAIAKQTSRALTGTVVSGGTLAAIKTALRSLTGTLTTSAALVKQPRKVLSAALSSTGVLVKEIRRAQTGSLTTAGALAAVKTALKSFTGTLTSAGVLSRRPQKSLAGSMPSSGALSNRSSRSLSGTVAPTGSLSKRTAKAFSGVLSFLGSLVGIGGGGIPTIGAVIDATVSPAVLARSAADAGAPRDLAPALLSRTVEFRG
jgi:hypothetical protein